MTRRILPPSEWPRLADTPQLGPIWHQLPVTARVVVVESDGRIVATWALLQVTHLEGAWVDPAFMRAAVPLMRGMREEAAQLGASTVWTGSVSDEVSRILARMGAQRVPFASFTLALTQGES